MSEIVSPESKLYVKEEVEKAKKEIKEDIEKANSKAARTFTTVGVVLGILTGVGVYGLAANYVKTAIKDGLSATAIIQLESNAKDIVGRIQDINTDAKDKKKELGKISEKVKKMDFVNLPIGTIIPSMLNPSRFAGEVGDPPDFDSENSKWALADGRAIPKSEYTKKYPDLKNVPDLRGMFLRGVNEGRKDGKQDPDERKPGDYQRDALQEHGHETTATGYQYNVLDQKSLYGWDGGDLGYTSTGDADIVPADVTSVKGPYKVLEETRPKNVAVYFYIKIN